MDEKDHLLHQARWHPDEISDPDVPGNPDTSFIFERWDGRVRDSATAAARPGRVLDVGSGDARDVVDLARRGWEAWGLDPSFRQLQEARKLLPSDGASVLLVRAISEFLPFKEAAFDVVICKSALDHFVDPSVPIREFARVLNPGGRAIISAVNYDGFTPKLCRIIYRALRFLRLIKPENERHRFWDSPVPLEHTFECTYKNMKGLGEQWMAELEACYGVSLFWGFPGWGRLLKPIPQVLTRPVLNALDILAYRLPPMADAVVFVWRVRAMALDDGRRQGKPKGESARPV